MNRSKTDNHNLRAKVELRRWFLQQYHAGTRPAVLDACQGAGKVWDCLRREFNVRYQGADLHLRRPGVKVDSSRIFDIPGWAFDVVDIDTYGEPWRHYAKLCGTVTSPITVFLTIGLIRPNGFGGNVSQYVRGAIGAPAETPACLLADLQRQMLDRLIWYPLGRLRLVDCREAPSGGNARYIGLRIEPRSQSPGKSSRSRRVKP